EQPIANGNVAVGHFAGARSGSGVDAKDAARGDAREWRSNMGDGDGSDVRRAARGAGAGSEFAGWGLRKNLVSSVRVHNSQAGADGNVYAGQWRVVGGGGDDGRWLGRVRGKSAGVSEELESAV